MSKKLILVFTRTIVCDKMDTWEKVGDIMTAQVLVEIKAKSIDKTFTYNIPKYLESEVMVGKRVLVPFGRQKIEGFVLK